ncbi:urease accessory protein UreE [Celerinatantimonas sp. YJH-8]|uniref:urease accessory protein UreE n=1 Tax=Celerinatantimonas sp. YJH-8 TaxID=3228714 RepID=UPI0038CA86BE
MLEIELRHAPDPAREVLTKVALDYEQRDKGRQKLVAENGEELRLFLERGKVLQIGELLEAKTGELVRVIGAIEEVCEARCEDWQTFAKACYHLGNRHVRLQVGDRWLRMKPDHVLEQMLELLGLKLSHSQQIFEPESGAYSHGHHAH